MATAKQRIPSDGDLFARQLVDSCAYFLGKLPPAQQQAIASAFFSNDPNHPVVRYLTTAVAEQLNAREARPRRRRAR